MSNKQNEVIREYIEENITKYENDSKSDFDDHYFCCHQDGECFAVPKEKIPYKYYDLPVTKWFNFIPKNLKINKEVTFADVKDDAN